MSGREQQLARLAAMLAEDGDTTLGARITAVQVLHRLQYGGRVASSDEWLLRIAAARQRQAARRWLR